MTKIFDVLFSDPELRSGRFFPLEYVAPPTQHQVGCIGLSRLPVPLGAAAAVFYYPDTAVPCQ